METPETAANRILAAAGLRPSDAARARIEIDRRLNAYGMRSVANPVPIPPGRSLLHADNTPDVVTALISGGEERLRGPDVELYSPDVEFGPDDAAAAVACTSLATTAAGGTETKFQSPGIVYVGAGPVGVFWTRAIGSSTNTRWNPVMSGVRLPYHPKSGLFFGTNTVGGIAVGGSLSLALYQMPTHHLGSKDAWKALHKQISDWTEGASDATGTAGAIMGFLGGGGGGLLSGTDVTLGTFSDAGVGTQIFKVGTNMPAGGAVARGSVILNTPNTNTDIIWVAETSALAVASNNGIGSMGQDTWPVPVGGKLFFFANTGTQKVGARFRS